MGENYEVCAIDGRKCGGICRNRRKRKVELCPAYYEKWIDEEKGDKRPKDRGY